jgi:hypothetical protein
MNSESIKKELTATTERLNELNEMRMRPNNNLQTLQDGFIAGKTSLDELQAAHQAFHLIIYLIGIIITK